MSVQRFIRARKLIDRQIRKAGARALLRRAGSDDRECWAMEAQLSASEKNSLKNPKHKVYSISAVGVDVPPGREDSLITFVQPGGTVELPPLRQVAPANPFSPGGIDIYWDLTVE